MVGSRSCWLDPDNSPPTIFSLASWFWRQPDPIVLCSILAPWDQTNTIHRVFQNVHICFSSSWPSSSCSSWQPQSILFKFVVSREILSFGRLLHSALSRSFRRVKISLVSMERTSGNAAVNKYSGDLNRELVWYSNGQFRNSQFLIRSPISLSSLDWLNFDFLYTAFIHTSILAPSTAFYLWRHS